MAYELTEAHPGLSVTVFDLPQVIEMRRHFQPRPHNDRVAFVAGQFILFMLKLFSMKWLLNSRVPPRGAFYWGGT